MQIAISEEKLTEFLNKNEDCEALTKDEYVVDLFDMEIPITLNLKLVEGGVEILAAAELIYDEEQDGWYMGQRIEDESRIAEALRRAMEVELEDA